MAVPAEEKTSSMKNAWAEKGKVKNGK